MAFIRKILLGIGLLSGILLSCTKDRLFEKAPTVTIVPEEDTLILPLKINEFLASNNGSSADENGEFDDWFEIYNPNAIQVDVGGYFVTDNLENLTFFQLPAGSSLTRIPPKGRLLIWCDGTPDQGPLHVPFKLSGSGEQIGLAKPNEEVVDTLTFVAQSSDISFGRIADGAIQWKFFSIPTPGEPNQ
jgi:hypothetical protein